MPLITISNAVVTAYCCCHTCCGPSAKGITASGARPVEGITIAAPLAVPFNTVVFVTVPGWMTNRPFAVQDRLSRRFPKRWDIFIATHARARQFGLQHATITYKLNEIQHRD